LKKVGLYTLKQGEGEKTEKRGGCSGTIQSFTGGRTRVRSEFKKVRETTKSMRGKEKKERDRSLTDGKDSKGKKRVGFSEKARWGEKPDASPRVL